MKSMLFHTAALLADSINDASSTRKVYLLAAGLALLGIALVVMTVWFWRSTRHDPELLAPLESMGDRRFRRLDGGAQQQVLDRSRPADAKPMRWGVVRGEASGDSAIDLRESLRTVPDGFDDLRDPALIAVALEESEVDAATAVEAPVAPTFVPSPAVIPAERDPLAEIDALLAQAGAVAVSDPVDAAEPMAAEPIGTDAAEIQLPTVPRGSKPGVAGDVVPLVIVPVDHELGPGSPRLQRRSEPAPEHLDDDVATEPAEDHDEPVSIDPLLRMFNRHDG